MKSTANDAMNACCISLQKSPTVFMYLRGIATKLKLAFRRGEDDILLSYLFTEVGVQGTEVEMVLPSEELSCLEAITSEKSAVGLFRRLWDNEMFDLQERLYAIYLDAGDNLVGSKLISIGSTTIKNAKPSYILKYAQEFSAAKIILAHNHPSGVCKTSASDLEYTSTILKAIESEHIELVSHYILTKKTHHAISLNKS